MAELRLAIPGVAESDILRIGSYWEHHFPGYGPAIVRDIVGPFYSPDITLALAGPVSDPVGLKQAVFWQPSTGLRIITPAGLGREIHGSYPSIGGCLRGRFNNLIDGITWRFIANCLDDHLVPSIKSRLAASAEAGAFKTQVGTLELNIWLTLLYAIAFTITGRPEPRLTTILQRHCQGNHLLGFDRHDVLMLLCAAQTTPV